MSKSDFDARRRFLAQMGGAAACTVAGVAVAKASTPRLFASQFLEKGRTVQVPAAEYDRTAKVLRDKATGGFVVADEQMTGVWTHSTTTQCTSMFYPNNGNPYCSQQDSDDDSHPDGFKPGE
jgi:hypothetical protein